MYEHQTGSARNTLIVEPNESGHRFYYVRLLAEAALERGDEVTIVTSPKARASSQATTHLSTLLNSVNIVVNERTGLELLRHLADTWLPDLIVVPDGDSSAIALGARPHWNRRVPLGLLVMRATAQPHRVPGMRSVKSLIRRFLFWRARRITGVRLFQLRSAALPEDLVRQHDAIDPVTLNATADDLLRLRRRVGVNSDATVIFSVLGVLDTRKNIPLIIDALNEADVPEAVLLLAGRLTDEVRTQLAERDRQEVASGLLIRVLDEVMTDSDLDAAVALSDCLVLAYTNEGPSGLVGKALAAGTRVLAAGSKSLRDDATYQPTMMTWVPLQVSSLSQAIVAVAADVRSGGRPTTKTLVAERKNEFTRPLLGG